MKIGFLRIRLSTLLIALLLWQVGADRGILPHIPFFSSGVAGTFTVKPETMHDKIMRIHQQSQTQYAKKSDNETIYELFAQHAQGYGNTANYDGVYSPVGNQDVKGIFDRFARQIGAVRHQKFAATNGATGNQKFQRVLANWVQAGASL